MSNKYLPPFFWNKHLGPLMVNMWWILGNIFVPELEIAPITDNENNNHGDCQQEEVDYCDLIDLILPFDSDRS